jgi:CheY-like chemotaxis protein
MNEVNHRILLIDDDSMANFVSIRILKKLNLFQYIKSVHTAEEGLEYILKCEIEKQNIDFIFLDLKLQGMKGQTFLEEYNKLHMLQRSKIILFAKHIRLEDKAFCLQNNVKHCIEKPLTLEKLDGIFT